MTLEEMCFDELNKYARFDGFSRKEIDKLDSLCIVKRREREHLCNSCEKCIRCFIKVNVSTNIERAHSHYYDIYECAFWEAKR